MLIIVQIAMFLHDLRCDHASAQSSLVYNAFLFIETFIHLFIRKTLEIFSFAVLMNYMDQPVLLVRFLNLKFTLILYIFGHFALMNKSNFQTDTRTAE